MAKDGLLVVRPNTPFASPSEQIIIPRTILDGIVTALHMKLDHPSKHQLKLVMKRHFYALDIAKVVDRVCDACHTCASLRKLPKPLIKHNSESPPYRVGVSFAADVLNRYKQAILILRETTTSFTSALIIPDEKSATLRDNLARLCAALRPTSVPHETIRVDPQWRAGRGGRGTMPPPAKIFRGRQTTTGALKLCKAKFSAKSLTLFKSHLEFIERNIRLSAV